MRVLETERSSQPHVNLTAYIQLQGELRPTALSKDCAAVCGLREMVRLNHELQPHPSRLWTWWIEGSGFEGMLTKKPKKRTRKAGASNRIWHVPRRENLNKSWNHSDSRPQNGQIMRKRNEPKMAHIQILVHRNSEIFDSVDIDTFTPVARLFLINPVHTTECNIFQNKLIPCWNNRRGLHFAAHAWGSKNEPVVPRFVIRTCSAQFAEKKIIEWFLLTTWEENSLFFSANWARPGSQRKIRKFQQGNSIWIRKKLMLQNKKFSCVERVIKRAVVLKRFSKCKEFSNMMRSSSNKEIPYLQGKNLFWKIRNLMVWRG